MGSKVFSSGGLDISGLHRDDGSVGVSDKAGGGVGNLGSVDLSSVDWHHSSVGVTNQGPGHSVSVGVVGSIGVAGSVGNGASSLSVGQSGSGNLGGLCWDHGTVGVGHQLG